MPLSEVVAERELARQMAWATGLVLLCAVVFVITRALEGRYAGLAYVAAFAEAAIIGALADWYAVVALFRHPLGLRLPHTAIIPANQARIAEQLGDFIARHFLAGERVAEKLLQLDPAGAAGRWLAEPANRERAVAQAEREALRDELGLLERIGALLAEPAAQEAIRDRIRAELPSLARFFKADAYVLAKLVAAAQSLLQEVREDPAHPLRAELRGFVLGGFGEFLAAAAERLRFAAAASSSRRLRSAIGRNCDPNAVSATLRVVRSNRRTPSCVSSSRTRTLIPDCVMKSCSAAREKLWCLAVRTKAFSCREVIFISNGDE